MWLQVYWANIVLQHKPNTVTEQWSTADCHPPNAYVCAIIDKVRCLPLCSTTVGIRLRLSSLFSLQVKWKSISINCTCFVFSLCYENSVPAPSYANIVPTSCYANSVPTSCYANSVPTSCYANSVPTSCYANSVPTSCYANSVPTSCYANSVLHVTKTMYLLHVTQTLCLLHGTQTLSLLRVLHSIKESETKRKRKHKQKKKNGTKQNKQNLRANKYNVKISSLFVCFHNNFQQKVSNFSLTDTRDCDHHSHCSEFFAVIISSLYKLVW